MVTFKHVQGCVWNVFLRKYILKIWCAPNTVTSHSQRSTEQVICNLTEKIKNTQRTCTLIRVSEQNER